MNKIRIKHKEPLDEVVFIFTEIWRDYKSHRAGWSDIDYHRMTAFDFFIKGMNHVKNSTKE